jgi:hypothetical protein
MTYSDLCFLWGSTELGIETNQQLGISDRTETDYSSIMVACRAAPGP